jgi:hypothetical protein
VVSRTYSITRTVGVETKVQDFLTTTVSNTIVNSVTTSIGVTITTTVPPRTRLLAEYGVESYEVSYAIEAYRSKRLAPNKPPPATGGSLVPGIGPYGCQTCLRSSASSSSTRTLPPPPALAGPLTALVGRG